MLFLDLCAKAIQQLPDNGSGSLSVCFAVLCFITVIFMLFTCFVGAGRLRICIVAYSTLAAAHLCFLAGLILFDSAVAICFLCAIGLVAGGIASYFVRPLSDRLMRCMLCAISSFELVCRLLSCFAYALPIQLITGAVFAAAAVILVSQAHKTAPAIITAIITALFGSVCAARLITDALSLAGLNAKLWPYIVLCVGGITVQLLLLRARYIKREKISQAFQRR